MRNVILAENSSFRVRSGSRCVYKRSYVLKDIKFVSWGNIFTFCLHLFMMIIQQPNPFCCNRSTTNLFMISFLSRTINFFFFFLSLWIYLWPVSSRSATQPGWRSPPIVTIFFLSLWMYLWHYHSWALPPLKRKVPWSSEQRTTQRYVFSCSMSSLWYCGSASRPWSTPQNL